MSFDNSLFDTLLEPVFILSAEGKVLYCNEPAALVCELSVRKILRGLLFKDLLTFAEPLEWLRDITLVSSPAPYKEVNFTSPSGQNGKVQVTVQPLTTRPPAEQNWIVFVRDVTLEERLQKKYRAELEQKEDVILDLQKAQSELEQYSKNLEHMVQERTQEISRMNRLMKALLDSLSQGFFIFDTQGKVLEVFSKACENTVESTPSGKNIWDVLKLPESKVHGFQRWMTTLFSEMLPFQDLVPLGPDSYPHSQGNHIALDYFPLRNAENQIDGVVVVATDITNLVEAQRQAVIEKQHAEMIIHLVRNKNQVGRFIRESTEMLQDLQRRMESPSVDIEAVFRCLHTLKGGAGMLSVLPMSEACHAAETTLSAYGSAPNEATASVLHTQCMSVATQFQLFTDKAKEVLGPAALSDERFLEISTSKLEAELQKFSLLPGGALLAERVLAQFTEEPVESFFLPYEETALKLAEQQDKVLHPLRFIHKSENAGTSITVSPEVYSGLFASFVHAFRNAVDHGLEMPAERRQAGKSEAGEIIVTFEVLSGPSRLKISVKDDGRGIDPEKIRTKLENKFKNEPQLWSAIAQETDQQVLQHVFDSQFSTKESITEISGRGVGLDAVKSEAQALGGHAWVTSEPGKGSCLTVEVPLLSKPSVARAAA